MEQGSATNPQVPSRPDGGGPRRAGRALTDLKTFSSLVREVCDRMGFPKSHIQGYRLEARTRKDSVVTTVPERLNLPALRSNKGISLREIAESTKISIRFLQAIEEGDFKQLPGGIYNTSYIRQYAREIGFEETTLLAYYQARTTISS